jgi:hypothetical protein
MPWRPGSTGNGGASRLQTGQTHHAAKV